MLLLEATPPISGFPGTPAPRDVDVRKNSEVFVQMFVLSSCCLPMYFDAQEVSQKSRYLCWRMSVCDALKQNVWSLSCEHCDL